MHNIVSVNLLLLTLMNEITLEDYTMYMSIRVTLNTTINFWILQLLSKLEKYHTKMFQIPFIRAITWILSIILFEEFHISSLSLVIQTFYVNANYAQLLKDSISRWYILYFKNKQNFIYWNIIISFLKLLIRYLDIWNLSEKFLSHLFFYKNFLFRLYFINNWKYFMSIKNYKFTFDVWINIHTYTIIKFPHYAKLLNLKINNISTEFSHLAIDELSRLLNKTLW